MFCFNTLNTIIADSNIIRYVKECAIKEVNIDTRTVEDGSNLLFIAIRGVNYDSHTFLKEAYDRGVRNFIVEKNNSHSYLYSNLPEANILEVPNSVDALQQMAVFNRKKSSAKVIAIAGSSGKTIVKEWLGSMISDNYSIIKSPKSYNSQIGVPLSIMFLKPNTQYAIFEAGISLPNEMEKLANVILPNIGIFTNIGDKHREGFDSLEHKAQEKIQLFKHSDKIYYRSDYEVIDSLLKKKYPSKELISWSLNGYSNALYNVILNDNTLHVKSDINGVNHSFTLPFKDDYNLENMIHCIIFCIHERIINYAHIQDKLLQLDNDTFKLVIKKGLNNCELVYDNYNNDLVGLKHAIGFMIKQKYNMGKTVILSNLLFNNFNLEEEINNVLELLHSTRITKFIGVGDNFYNYKHLFKGIEQTYFYKTTKEFIEDISLHTFKDEIILIKGDKRIDLNNIMYPISKKVHKTTLEINLDAISNNFNVFRKSLNPNTKIMGMIKAHAYGSGDYEIAKVLESNHIDYLCVAYIDEGIILRRKGIKLPIMVMIPNIENINELVEYDLEPEVYSLEVLEKIAFLNKPIKAHIKLDTGMNRLGLKENDLGRAIDIINNASQIQVVSILSHLVASDSKEHDDFTHEQVKLFLSWSKKIESALSIKALKHILNSNGVARFPQYQLDMVRVGIGLYGIVHRSSNLRAKLQYGTTLKAPIIQIKNIKIGESVGYNRRYIADKPMSIATIGLGYADGLPRALGNGKGKVYANGQLAPILGEVCMDMTMIDVTNMSIKENDNITIFGPDNVLDDLIANTDLIPHEVLSNISPRVHKLYYTE